MAAPSKSFSVNGIPGFSRVGSASQEDNSKIYEKYATFVAIRSGNVL
ncbi:hypothetical protein B4098_0127 [Heyndrickxia coagulans]|uniref:Uncharacterized protein n=1 Tax=Heyndrickxia coagulans TaxID=1398 RepID=A0A150JR32_HEYCO|nr:hypothetical protein B4098_0127 [Heyndrickxia coagulans]